MQVEGKSYKGIGISPAQCGPMTLQYRKVQYSAAELKAMNTTPVELVGYPGAGKALLLDKVVLNEHGGSTDYDQDSDITVVYWTEGGAAGTTVSTAANDFLNDGTAGSVAVISRITTNDELSENGFTLEEGHAFYLSATASPYNAAGDRLMTAHVWYWVVPVLT